MVKVIVLADKDLSTCPLSLPTVLQVCLVFTSRLPKFGFILHFVTLVWGPFILRGNINGDFSRCCAMCHLTLLEMPAEMCRIRSSPTLTPQAPPSLASPQTEGVPCRGCSHWEFGDGTNMEMLPYTFFHIVSFSYPNLTGTDGDSSDCGPGLWGSLHGKCFKSGQEPLRGTGCWPKVAGL